MASSTEHHIGQHLCQRSIDPYLALAQKSNASQYLSDSLSGGSSLLLTADRHPKYALNIMDTSLFFYNYCMFSVKNKIFILFFFTLYSFQGFLVFFYIFNTSINTTVDVRVLDLYGRVCEPNYYIIIIEKL